MSEQLASGDGSLEAAHGYEPMITEQPEKTSFADAEEAAESLPAIEIPAPVPIKVIDPATGEEAAPNKTLTMEQAADILDKHYKERDAFAEVLGDIEFQNFVDGARTEAQNHYLVDAQGRLIPINADDPAQTENAKAPEQKSEQPKDVEAEPEAETQEPAKESEPGPDGLTDETRAALQNPQIRQAIEHTMAQVEAAQRQYANDTLQATQLAAASLYAAAPELQGLSQQQAIGALAVLQQQNPQRFTEIATHLHRVGAIMQQHQAAIQQQTQWQQARTAEWVKAQDAEVEREFAGMPESERTALAKEAKRALIDYGVKEEELPALWNNSILRSVPAQRLLADAARYRLAKRGASRTSAQPVRAAQKPGTNAHPPTTRFDSKIRALEGKSDLTPDEAAELLHMKGSRNKAMSR